MEPPASKFASAVFERVHEVSEDVTIALNQLSLDDPGAAKALDTEFKHFTATHGNEDEAPQELVEDSWPAFAEAAQRILRSLKGRLSLVLSQWARRVFILLDELLSLLKLRPSGRFTDHHPPHLAVSSSRCPRRSVDSAAQSAVTTRLTSISGAALPGEFPTDLSAIA